MELVEEEEAKQKMPARMPDTLLVPSQLNLDQQ